MLLGLVDVHKAEASSLGFEWKIGVAKKDITPKENMWMAGYGHRDKISEGVVHPIWAKCLVFEDQFGEKAVLITTDLLGMPKGLTDELREKLRDHFSSPKSHLLINSSHTHTGPVLDNSLFDIYPLNSVEIKKIQHYSEWLIDELVQLVDDAFSDLEPAKLYSENGISRVQVNRRNNVEADIDKLAELKGPNDFSVPVLKAETMSGEIKAIAFGYACHPTVLGTYEWSGDYPGFAQIELERIYPGAIAMFFQGAGGDQNPLPRRTVALARQYGKSLAASVERVLEEEMKPLSAVFSASYEEISLPFEKGPSIADLEKVKKDNSGYVNRWASRLKVELESGNKLQESYDYYPIQTWKLGGQQLVALGGEVTVEYAIKLKELLGRDLFVLGYSNDVMNYIPSEKILEEGGYEGHLSHMVYGLPSKWAPGIEDKIISTAVKLTNELK